jgi:hypothetical protein
MLTITKWSVLPTRVNLLLRSFLALALVDVSKRIYSKFTNADIIIVMIMALTFINKLPTDIHNLQLPS